MTKNTTPYLRNDLKKRTSVSDVFFFNNISFQACMAMLFVLTVLLFTALSIATTPNPSILFGV